MYQLAIDCSEGRALEEWLDGLHGRVTRSGIPDTSLLFHVLNTSVDKEAYVDVVDAIRARFPQAPYLGCSTLANIVDGELVEGRAAVSVICSVFEDPTTAVELMQLPLDYGCQEATAKALLDKLASRPDVKAVEVMNTVASANMPEFCRRLSDASEQVVMFGGGSLNAAIDFEDVVVFSSEGAASAGGIVFVLYSGDGFHVDTKLVQGWKPLGMPFRITRAERTTLYEMNGKPALDIYKHYLQITSDDNFLQNGLCFPLSIDYDGTQVLRTPIATTPEGSLIMPTDVSDMHGDCHIAYGDPIAILASVQDCVSEIWEFNPQAIMAFGCVARLLYWGPEYAMCETRPFQSVAPISGFYTGGELIRHGRDFTYHNLALVLVGLREGGPDPDARAPRKSEDTPMAMSLQLSLIGRMASFIGAAAEELQEANRRMDAIARTDGLTGLANRREVERMVVSAVRSWADAGDGAATDPPSVIMFDLDDFKQVNDTYGHEAGDEVLRRMASMLKQDIDQGSYDAVPGRWGGEEFMVVLPESPLEDAFRLAETLRRHFAAIEFGDIGRCTMSIGIAQLQGGETSDRLCSRADNALYRAKSLGKNRTVIDG